MAVVPEDTTARAVSGCIQQFGNLALAPVLQKQFIRLFADGGFFGFEDEFAVFPLVAILETGSAPLVMVVVAGAGALRYSHASASHGENSP